MAERSVMTHTVPSMIAEDSGGVLDGLLLCKAA